MRCHVAVLEHDRSSYMIHYYLSLLIIIFNYAICPVADFELHLTLVTTFNLQVTVTATKAVTVN